MTILIAQIADIHIDKPTDLGLKRAKAIGAAIAAECDGATRQVALAICGDAAYSGQKKQFTLAEKFIQDITNELIGRHKNIETVMILVPGNHDCDFSGDQAARDGIIQLIKDTESPAESIADLTLKPLKEYFKFANASPDRDAAITKDSPFYKSFDLSSEGKTLRFHLFNTAWMSTIHEKTGSISFPLSEIAPPGSPAACSIAILHHPINWFSQPHVLRQLRDKVNSISSVVLVNHEHTSEARIETPLMEKEGVSTKTVYVAGGVIQEWEQPDVCSFNTLKIELDQQTLCVSRHELNAKSSTQHFTCTGIEEVSLSETSLSVGPAGASLKKEMLDFLEDPGAPVNHPNRDPRIPIRLSDIFLYPDLWELDADHGGSDQKQVKSANVADEVLATEKALITGGEKSGRTSIAKRLYLDAFDAGKVPLLITGGDIPKKVNKLRERLRKAVREQYQNLSPDQYEQIPSEKRVVIVDDAHRMSPASSQRKTLLEDLESRFSSVILCGDELIKLDEMNASDARDSGLWEYRHLIIVGFGECLREEFVRNWILLGGDTAMDDQMLLLEVERISSLLNAIIRKQLLPAYPLFLLVILQQSDLATANVQSGSFGVLFDGLITALLNKSSYTRISISDKRYYLAALAKEMFDRKTMQLPNDQVRLWHKSYWDEIEIDIPFDRLTSDLEALGILRMAETHLQFKYSYFFCFFVAYHLNQTMHESESKAIISSLSRQLYHRVSADIVLFLAHLTGDPIVLNEMVKTCDSLFVGVPLANLGKDVAPLNRLASTIEEIVIPDSPDENRRQVKLRRDAEVSERLAATKAADQIMPPTAENDAVKRLFEIHAAYKTIQILGQAVRNVAGSEKKGRKGEVIEKLVDLSRRVLGSYFQLFQGENLPHVVEDIAAAHKEQQPDLVESDLHEQVSRHLNGLSTFICFSMIKHTTFSVGSENLAPTIRRILGKSDEPILKILDVAFDLERPNRFPTDRSLQLFQGLRKNHFSSSLVRILVANHIYLYVVPVADRQRVAEKMSIKLLPVVLDRSRKRLT
ncbi:hypothetical protein [Rosistilla oblonga]|uniref:STAND family AAA ATPase n=1 Tax=Rosistilla oblonga TaxID=2527990 RepID=UPI003A975B1C